MWTPNWIICSILHVYYYIRVAKTYWQYKLKEIQDRPDIHSPQAKEYGSQGQIIADIQEKSNLRWCGETLIPICEGTSYQGLECGKFRGVEKGISHRIIKL